MKEILPPSRWHPAVTMAQHSFAMLAPTSPLGVAIRLTSVARSASVAPGEPHCQPQGGAMKPIYTIWLQDLNQSGDARCHSARADRFILRPLAAHGAGLPAHAAQPKTAQPGEDLPRLDRRGHSGHHGRATRSSGSPGFRERRNAVGALASASYDGPIRLPVAASPSLPAPGAGDPDHRGHGTPAPLFPASAYAPEMPLSPVAAAAMRLPERRSSWKAPAKSGPDCAAF